MCFAIGSQHQRIRDVFLFGPGARCPTKNTSVCGLMPGAQPKTRLESRTKKFIRHFILQANVVCKTLGFAKAFGAPWLPRAFSCHACGVP